MIDVVGFTKRYGSRTILDRIELAVEPGTTLVVVGGSGCGKSTLLRHVAGIEGPDTGEIQGRIRVGDHADITRTSEAELYRTKVRGPFIGLQFQAGALFDTLSVYENIAWPLRENTRLDRVEIRVRIEEVVEMVEMQHVPGVLDKRPAELSGGQQRRIALARALALQPRVMLYDEPTAGLDPPVAAGIGRLIRRLQDERRLTAMVATHDMILARLTADRLAMMRDGRIVFHGRLDEAMRDAQVRDFMQGGSGDDAQQSS